MPNEIPLIINDFRLSTFVIKVEVENGWLLYNTATGGIVEIENETDLYESLDQLMDLFFYVPMDFDEFNWVDNKRKAKNCAKKNYITGFTILTTTDCNARCFYCYEKGQSKISMTEQTAVDVADYIIDKSQGKPVDIRWFGGEPLFNSKVIDIICERIANSGIDFKSKMISNGLLFNDSLITKAKEKWKLKKVQITLDGTKEIYQKSKAYKNATGDEYDRVIENISKLSDAGIKVSIRLNQNIDNTENLISLVNHLSVVLNGKKGVSVYNCLLFEDDKTVNAGFDTEKCECFKRLQNEIIECGLFRTIYLKKKIRLFHCMADYDSSVIITPTGKIGKCEHYTDQHIIGSIYDQNIDGEENLKWKELYQPTPKCLKCPLYPQCMRIKMCPVETANCSYVDCENRIELIQRALLKKHVND